MAEKKQVEQPAVVTRLCTECGCKGSGSCGRAIEPDGSVRPSRDTGFRFQGGRQ